MDACIKLKEFLEKKEELPREEIDKKVEMKKEKTSRFIQLTQAVFLISLVQINLG